MPLTDDDISRIAALITESESRTRALITESESRTLSRVASMITESESRTLNRIEGRLDAIELRINERTAHAIEDSATKLLTAFHNWASPMDQRVRSHAAAIRALDLEAESLGDRLTKLEPPH
jgi:hypothetical protein